MDNLEDKLRRLSKIEPSKGFIKASKNRLFQQIEIHKHESWLVSLLRKIGIAQPDQAFLAQARLRLMHRIAQAPVRHMARTLLFLQKAVASTLVMVIAVTTTLFVVEGRTVVEASDDSYLEVLSGTASVKHADLLLWEDINGQIEVKAGDLIKVGEGSSAVVHFFDDSELRLGANSMFLISQLAVSPSFGRQGIIEVALQQGSAWVQTLNVDDGYAGFVLSTRDSLLKALNGTFSVQTTQSDPTEIMVLNNKAELSVLKPETREVVSTVKLALNDKAKIHVSSPSANPILTSGTVTEQDLATDWAQSNLRKDSQHLADLREKGFERLTQMAGTLPGDMLYPIKQAKERLRLLVSGGGDLAVQIEQANSRLSEAIVLLENGNTQKGREALLSYQSIARQLAETTGSDEIAHQLITPYQKTIAAELPNDAAIGLVKDALHETAEILATDQVELERVRLVNSVDRLRDVLKLVEMADFSGARDRLVSHQLVGDDVLAVIQGLEGDAQKELAQEVLELRQEEVSLLGTITEKLAAVQGSDQQLSAMLESAQKQAQENVDETLAFAAPIIPNVVAEVTEEPSALELKIADLIDHIYIYNSWDGQQNQIERLLKNELNDTNSIDYLVQVRDSLTGRAADYLNVRILQLENKAAFQKHKLMQQKIEESQSLRQS